MSTGSSGSINQNTALSNSSFIYYTIVLLLVIVKRSLWFTALCSVVPGFRFLLWFYYRFWLWWLGFVYYINSTGITQ